MKKTEILILLTTAMLLLTACGGGSDSTSTSAKNVQGATSTNYIGTLIDSKVEGVRYVCDNNNSSLHYTNQDGQFSCTSLPIKFYVGNLKLGEISTLPSDNEVHLQDFFSDIERSNTSDSRVIKIARLLQSLDNNNNPDDGIVISKTRSNLFTNNMDIIDFDLATLSQKDNTIQLVSAEQATEHLNFSNQEAPVITLNGENPINLNIGESYNEVGATALDSVDGSVTVVPHGTVDNTVEGTYTITYVASDEEGHESSKTRTVNVIDISKHKSLAIPISLSSDDAEEFNKNITLKSSDLELITDGTDNQVVGLRFQNIHIPKNSTITHAYIQFQVDETSSEETNLIIHGEKIANAATFSNEKSNISNRNKTTASTTWSPEAWKNTKAMGTAQQTDDLTAILTELIGQNDWNKGNAMAFIISGSGKRVAKSFDNTKSTPPTLHVEFISSEVSSKDTTAPIIQLNGENPLTLTVGNTYNEVGASANDDVDGVINVTTTGKVDTTKVGRYLITYSASDSSGNIATTQRVINVVKNNHTNEPTINVSNSNELKEAIRTANDGDTILLAPGTYADINNSLILQNNLTIASYYHTTGDEKYIRSTIIQGTGDKTDRIFDGNREKGASENIKIIGLTAKSSGKFITFTYGDHNLVDHCILDHIKRDAVSFDSAATGKVLHSKFYNSGDDAIDVDSNKGKTGGSFEFAHNTILDTYDDGIEIHLWYNEGDEKIKKTMHFSIHDNHIENSGSDGIQLIDFDKTQDNAEIDPHDAVDKATHTNRSFEIYKNLFKNNGQVAVGCIFQSSQHTDSDRDPSRHFSGANMSEEISIHHNKFENGEYHILGGDNINVSNNIFNGASVVSIKRVKGESVINSNNFSQNKKDKEDSN